MPPGFTLGYGEQVWIPLDVSRILTYVYRARKMHFLYGVGRLKPEVTLEAANADLNTISRRLETQYPEANTGHTVVAVDMRSAMVGDLPLRALLSVSSAL